MKLKGLKIGKLNILDISIILVVIIFIGIFGVNNLKNENSVAAGTNSVTSTFSYNFFVEGLSDTSSGMLQVGDEVYDKVANTYIGKIKELEIVDAKAFVEKENGELIECTVPGKIDVNMMVETEGTIKNGEYLANGLIRILVGNTKEIKTKYLMCTGTVAGIEK